MPIPTEAEEREMDEYAEIIRQETERDERIRHWAEKANELLREQEVEDGREK